MSEKRQYKKALDKRPKKTVTFYIDESLVNDFKAEVKPIFEKYKLFEYNIRVNDQKADKADKGV